MFVANKFSIRPRIRPTARDLRENHSQTPDSCAILRHNESMWAAGGKSGATGAVGTVRALTKWIAKYGDEIVAILLTLVLFVLGWQDIVGATAINNTILLVLAVMIAGNLRDRYSVHGMHERVLGELAGATEIRVLTGSQVATELRAARHTTEFWHFRGGTGTYLRAVTLPECVANSREQRRSFAMYIEIIDPTHPEVCKLYADFRSSVSPSEDEPWTPERTRKEAYATILAACWWQQTYNLLNVELALTTRMTTFRWDMSSASVIQTQENAAGQALLFPHDKTYYNYWREELKRSFAQVPTKVPMHRAGEVKLGKEPSVDEVLALFRALGIPLPSEYQERDVAQVVAKALKPRNPYATWGDVESGGSR